MKEVIGVSIGLSERDFETEFEILGETVHLKRIGTDGDIRKAEELIRAYDGKVDAFGMGGIDMSLNAYGDKKYLLKAARPLAEAAKITPILDGTGLKNTLERRVVYYLNDDLGVPVKDKKVFLTCALDRFGMADSFEALGADMVCGDMMFTIGIGIPLSKKRLNSLAKVLFPVVSRLPFSMLYPTGDKQKQRKPKFVRYYREAEIVAGDFLYIIKHMPDGMDGKIVVTNTVTQKDLDEMKAKGVKMVVTSTPMFAGRAFGTNMIEAAFVAALGKRPEEITAEDYNALLDQMGPIHHCTVLN